MVISTRTFCGGGRGHLLQGACHKLGEAGVGALVEVEHEVVAFHLQLGLELGLGLGEVEH